MYNVNALIKMNVRDCICKVTFDKKKLIKLDFEIVLLSLSIYVYLYVLGVGNLHC